MTDRETPIAAIYCRVSSTKQVREGHGLESQESRCRDYASYKGYEVVEIFRDEGVSGGMIDRPGMQDLLAFLRKHSGDVKPVVVIDDISRLARGIEAHIQLRTAIDAAGGQLESPSIEFGDDPDSMLVENLLAQRFPASAPEERGAGGEPHEGPGEGWLLGILANRWVSV